MGTMERILSNGRRCNRDSLERKDLPNLELSRPIAAWGWLSNLRARLHLRAMESLEKARDVSMIAQHEGIDRRHLEDSISSSRWNLG